jgi:nitrogen fixation-related uncharacterized protein
MMPLGLWIVVAWMVFVVITGIVLLIYAWHSGQFKNVEEPKYRMLEEKEPQDWPGRGTRRGGAS